MHFYNANSRTLNGQNNSCHFAPLQNSFYILYCKMFLYVLYSCMITLSISAVYSIFHFTFWFLCLGRRWLTCPRMLEQSRFESLTLCCFVAHSLCANFTMNIVWTNILYFAFCFLLAVTIILEWLVWLYIGYLFFYSFPILLYVEKKNAKIFVQIVYFNTYDSVYVLDFYIFALF